MQKLIILFVCLALLFFMTRLAINYFSANKVATGLIDADTTAPSLHACDNLLNCTSSTASNNKNQIAAMEYTVPADKAIASFSDLIAAQPGASIVAQQPNYLHATFKTKLLGFIDDLELLLDDADGTLHVRSASRIGRSDLGANRKRIEAIRALSKGEV